MKKLFDIINNKACLLLFTQIVFFLTTQAQNKIEFIENKNQWENHILFKAEMKNAAIFLEEKSLCFNFLSDEDSHTNHGHTSVPKQKSLCEEVHFHAYKIEFLNSKIDKSKIQGFSPKKSYNNYFLGNNPERWASFVRKYKTVEYKDLYNNIDLKIYSINENLKYDFVLRKGGDIGEIELFYEGVEKIEIKNGNLIISTTVNKIAELKPFAYQIINNDTIKIACKYKLKGNSLFFEIDENYDKSKNLVIDPTLVFSNYSGSTADNWGFTATFDLNQNVYSGGIVSGIGYPVTTGAFQQNYAGTNANAWDIGIIKYSSDGASRIFSTYIGGSSSEMPHSLVANRYNELLIFGTTGSGNFPVSANAYDNSFNGGDALNYDNAINFQSGSDIFVFRLSENGDQMIASTFVGGSKNDGINYKSSYGNHILHGNDSLYFNYGDGARGEIVVDDSNFVYVASCTFSDDFPTSLNSVQDTSNGNQEGVVFKLNPQLSNLEWSTFLGGSQNDAIYSIDIARNSEVFVAGGTCSQDFPTSSGVLDQNYLGGSTDGFVSRISANGQFLLSSTFFGSDAYDQVYFVRIANSNKIFICGQTKATGSTLVYNALYNIPNSGQFISNLSYDLTNLNWSTTFGTGNGKPNISITAFTADICNRVYLSGWGREWGGMDGNTWGSIEGTKNMEITNDAYQDSTDGQDFYVMILSEDAQTLEYASYFGELHYTGCTRSGGDHVDGGTSRFDRFGYIYQSVCASCGGCQEFPIFPDPHPDTLSASNASTNCNNAIFKIAFNFPMTIADFKVPQSNCFPVEIEFENISQDATTFEWTLPDGSTSTNVNSSFYFTEAGLFEITLVANSTETCNLSDTITKIVKIEENVVETLAALHYCLGDSILVGFSPSGNPNVSYLWDNSTFLTESNISNPLAFPDETTTFILSSIEGSCIDTSYQTVYVHTLNFNLSVDDNSICQGDTAILILETDGSYHDISWAIDPGFNNSFNYIDTILPVSPDTTQIYYLNITNQYCDILSEETVFVSAIYIEPLQDYTICIYDYLEIVAENTYPGQSYFFDWKPEEIVIEGASTSSPLIYTEEQTSVFVEIENQEGCKLVDTVEIFISEFSLTELEVYADDDTIYYGQSTILHTNQFDNLNFQWFPAHYLNADTIAEPTASPTENTVFSAFVNDEFSCEKNDSVEIVVLDVFCNEDYVFVPNAFTPNDDGHNDILYVYSEMVRDIFFAIYDRWGKMVFSTKDITKGWDGTYKNKELDPAVFVYYLEVTCWDYSNFSKKGNITLLR